MVSRNLFFLLIIPLLFLVGFIHGQGDASDDATGSLEQGKSELQGLQQKIKNERGQLKKAQEKEKKFVSELNSIEKNLAAKEKSLREYKAQLVEKKKEIESLTQEIAELQNRAHDQEAHLSRYAVDLYKLSRADFIKAVFAAQSFSDLLRRHEYLTRIIDYNEAMIDCYAEDIKKIEHDRNRLRASEDRLTELTDKARSTQQQVLLRKEEKRKLLARVKTEKDLHLSSIGELEESARQLQSLIEKLEQRARTLPEGTRPKHFSSHKSKFIFPVDGDIITHFGKHEDVQFATITFNNGIEIRAALGSAIRAVFDGVVIYADWFKGYGNLLIIDHGEGYYTLSGHASELLKKVGEQVAEGETIGYVGDTGSLKGANLYFEIRHHGKPVDPVEWLASRR